MTSDRPPPSTERRDGRELRPFPIVGVGASAGGIDAYKQLLEALPADTGMAFVVVLHLDPGHQSMLAEILGRVTTMRVMEVRDEPRVEPNCVYVIPPNRTMLMANGHLTLSPRTEIHGQHRSIDAFLRSLAEDHGHSAIGVILSGTGTDGTLGLEAIKAEGGITFAQDHGSAQHDGMPHSAVAAGCVDFVLSPAAIAEELVRIGCHPYVRPEDAIAKSAARQTDESQDLQRILRLLGEVTGVDFFHYKSRTLHRRISRRMLLHRLETLADYLAMLVGNPAEVQSLYHDLLINVTAFFRDPDCFETITRKILPRLAAGRSRAHPLRIWVLGCSTGEEAYSLAILVNEFAAGQCMDLPVQLFASDLSERGIEKARSGLYSKNIAEDVSPERLQRFFVETQGGFQVVKAIREMCVFARQNVLADPPFSHLDLISCRNLLIYMEPALQKRLIPMFHYALKPGGYLWLGTSETVSGYDELFQATEPKHKIFARKPGPATIVAPTRSPRVPWEPRHLVPSAGTRNVEDAGVDLQREADRLVAATYAPPGVLVNAALEVLQFRGDTSRYLAQAPGKPSLNVLKMAREGLLDALRTALEECAKRGAPVRQAGARVRTDNGFTGVDLQVLPMRGGTGDSHTFLVLFESRADGTPSPADSSHRVGPPQRGDEPDLVARLTDELSATREYMQSLVEQQEAANDEMQSANEEIQSANEELQSVNEELQTSKEEIQSSNEELTTVNDELRHRNDQLDRAHSDLSNFLAASQLAMVMVDTDLRIRHFSTAAGSLLKLIAADIGRPIGDLKLTLDRTDMSALVAQVIDTTRPCEREVQDRFERWYSLRVLPYRTPDNTIDGAVVLLVDIEQQKQAQEEIRASEEKYRLLVEGATGVAIMRLDADGRVSGWNTGAERIFGFTESEIAGQHLSLFFVPEDVTEHMPGRELDQARREQPCNDERWLMRKDGTRFWASGTTTALKDEGGNVCGFSKVVRDVTERKRTDEALKTSEQRYRELVNALPAAVYTCDTDGRITLYNGAAAALWGREPDVSSDRWCGAWRLYEADGRVLAPEDCPMAVAVRDGRAVRGREIVVERHDGTRTRVLPCPEPVLDESGAVVGAINMLVDLTEISRAETALLESNARLEAALSAAHMGTWIWYIEEDRQVLDASLRTLMAVDPDHGVDALEDFVAHVHPDDREDVHAAFHRCAEDRGELDLDFRVIWPDDSVHWLRDRGRFSKDHELGECLTGACVDITDLRAAELALRDADRRKDEFLATLAHELRNPLAPIVTALEVMRRGGTDPAAFANSRQIVERQVRNLTRLVDDLLDIARISRGKVELREDSVDLVSVVQRAIESAEPHMAAGAHQLTVALPSQPVWTRGDALRLEQVIANLLQNAAKYTDPGGQIAVSLRTSAPIGDTSLTEATISVRDTGVGLSAESLDTIFDAFVRIDLSYARHNGGLGIGLSLVKRLVELHRGRVEARSAGLGHGSEFIVHLPLRSVPLQASGAAAAAENRSPFSARRILVVDDNVDAAESQGELLRLAGHETRVAHSGPAALQIVEVFQPDIVLLDIGMPGMDGYEVARQMRQRANLMPTILVAVTGYGTDQDRVRSEAAGFDAHLVKPIEPDELRRILRLPSA